MDGFMKNQLIFFSIKLYNGNDIFNPTTANMRTTGQYAQLN